MQPFIRRILAYVVLISMFVACEPALAAVVNFDRTYASSAYDDDELDIDFNTPPWENGVDEGRVSIVSGADAFAGNSLAVSFPTGTVGPSGSNSGGAQWRWEFDQTATEMTLSYRVRFGPGFDFVKGGKLPGLVGGANPTNDGGPGWSARMMWREDGRVIQYVYDQDASRDRDFDYQIDGQDVFFTADQWHEVKHRIVLNTPGQDNGVIQAWFDGQLALDVNDVRFRDPSGDGGASTEIDAMFFSTFFGGNDSTWAATADETIFFDEFNVTTISAVPEPSSCCGVLLAVCWGLRSRSRRKRRFSVCHI